MQTIWTVEYGAQTEDESAKQVVKHWKGVKLRAWHVELIEFSCHLDGCRVSVELKVVGADPREVHIFCIL